AHPRRDGRAPLVGELYRDAGFRWCGTAVLPLMTVIGLSATWPWTAGSKRTCGIGDVELPVRRPDRHVEEDRPDARHEVRSARESRRVRVGVDDEHVAVGQREGLANAARAQ